MLEQSTPHFRQALHGWLSSHLIRFTRHDSQARATWLRFGRLVSVIPEAEPIGELDTAEAPSALECFFDVEVWRVEAVRPWCREEFAAKVVYIERSLD